MRRIVPIALRAAASTCPKHAAKLEAAAIACETVKTRDEAIVEAKNASQVAHAAADAAAAAYAADANAKRDEILSMSADIACDALIECGSEGAKYLWLCDEVAA